MGKLRTFVESKEAWFRGQGNETAARLSAAEQQLGLLFPTDLKWLLMTHGYGNATPISSLDDMVNTTLRARHYLNLPAHMLVLHDLGDSGAFILDTAGDFCQIDDPVYGVEWENVSDNIQSGVRFESIADYISYLIDEVITAMSAAEPKAMVINDERPFAEVA